MNTMDLLRMQQLGNWTDSISSVLPGITSAVTGVTPREGSTGGLPTHVFDTVSSLVSQFLGSRGKYQTTQLNAGGAFTVQPFNPYASAQGPVNPYANMTAEQYAAYQRQGVGGTVGSGVDGIFNWLMANPLITFGGIAALFLLFREPPRRR